MDRSVNPAEAQTGQVIPPALPFRGIRSARLSAQGFQLGQARPASLP
jgi:hypothetical protein